MALCAKCTEINLEKGLLYELDTFDSTKQSAGNGCAGCEFFVQSAGRHIDLNRVDPEVVLYLRRIGKTDNRVDLRFSPRDGEHELGHEYIPLRLCSAYGFEPAFAAEYEGENERFLGRVIAKNSGDPECIDLALAWMERCSRLHEGSCYPQADAPLPSRLVWIGDADQKLQLRITKGLRGRYVALSYSWGNKTTFMTNRATFEDKQSGFKAEMLPQTLQDAIHTARKLGFHYIWIDALCIIQGDSVDWAYESSKMAEVYGNSTLTICADVSGKSEEGIFRKRDSIHSHNFGLDDQFCLQTRGLGWQTMAAVPAYNPLSSRGWALQERLLSQRMLHFLKEQIAWECRTTLYTEELRCRQPKPKWHFTVREIAGCLPFARANEGKEPTLKSQLRGWYSAVQELAVRDFTFPSDRLLSLSGLASAIETPQLGKYLAGVWEKFAFSCMLWFPRWSQTVSEYRAPSWSWASFEGQLIDLWKAYEHYYPEDLDDMKVEAIKKDWDFWASQFHPRLLGHHILYKSGDIPGEVLQGSFLVVSGCCRAIYIMDDPNETFNEWAAFSPLGLRENVVFMDKKATRKKCKSVFAFEEDLSSLDPAVELKKYTCFLIGRERVPRGPKTLGLVLAQVSQMEEVTFERVGIVAFDQPRELDEDEDVWERERQEKWEMKTFRFI
ncbi:hypothetical protein LAWI1_G007704 [Lachnellula willkommii]|uniref:Heterokaryon incompatibility domain-containing protein n=1 Tax=Lachnellula willkommii TaxID=215461 RepID=A0A559M606_9HELO|nr:hypothetical protein LAWI1_G007704 [Lachnellula willkommii]